MGGHYSTYPRASPVCQGQSLQHNLAPIVLSSEDLKVLGFSYLGVIMRARVIQSLAILLLCQSRYLAGERACAPSLLSHCNTPFVSFNVQIGAHSDPLKLILSFPDL